MATVESMEPDTSFLHLLHRAAQVAAHNFMSEQSGDNRLSDRQFIVLAALVRKEGTSQAEISHDTGIDRSTMADVVKRLQSRGWVARRRSKSDGRAYAVKLTAEGRDVLRDASTAAVRAQEALANLFSPKELRSAVNLLQRISDVRSSAADEPARMPAARGRSGR